MKNTKKLAGLLLALIMVFAISTTVFAVDNTTITAPSGSSRSYDVYQIFTGDLVGGALSNVKWGKNGTGTEGNAVDDTTINALIAVNGSSTTDKEKLTEIKKYVNLESEKFGTVSDGSPLNAPTGYYLIKDNGPVGDGEAYSLYVVEVVGPTTINPKVSTVSSEKKVDDKNDSNTTQDAITWEDSADYDIGDDVPFLLKATIAMDYDNYKVYKLTFHDKEAPGLTFNSSSVVVKVDGNTISSGYNVITSGIDDGDTFEVKFADLKQISAVHAGSVITVEYTSTLNDSAEIGSLGNKNTMHVTYSNNPNDEAETASENGKTPDDTVIVFTYKVVVNKVDQNNSPLKGAGFTLYKKDASGNYNAIGTEKKGTDMTTFEWVGIDDGDYKLVETTTPQGYNTIADIEFTVTASHDILSDDPKLTSLTGDTFTGAVDTGILSANVVNKAGATLPETGGMGTTILYVLGGILVLVAAVLLVSKRRMSKNS
ncbi:MAG: isopeptide-forming domain-containing fimbrial protein [Acutalibacteraceae bacterium]